MLAAKTMEETPSPPEASKDHPDWVALIPANVLAFS